MFVLKNVVQKNYFHRNSLNTEVTITREGNFSRTARDQVEEINIFKGLVKM